MTQTDKPAPVPAQVTLHGRSRVLELDFGAGEVFRLPFELLRVYSPSAEVRGHSPDQAVLQRDKQAVDIVALEPVGNYALQPHFSDGHRSGIYSWAYLYEMGRNQQAWWEDYQRRVAAADLQSGQSGQSGEQDGGKSGHGGCRH